MPSQNSHRQDRRNSYLSTPKLMIKLIGMPRTSANTGRSTYLTEAWKTETTSTEMLELVETSDRAVAESTAGLES